METISSRAMQFLGAVLLPVPGFGKIPVTHNHPDVKYAPTGRWRAQCKSSSSQPVPDSSASAKISPACRQCPEPLLRHLHPANNRLPPRFASGRIRHPAAKRIQASDASSFPAAGRSESLPTKTPGCPLSAVKQLKHSFGCSLTFLKRLKRRNGYEICRLFLLKI